jgi:hypothetical protein
MNYSAAGQGLPPANLLLAGYPQVSDRKIKLTS